MYTVKEISKAYKISIELIRLRARDLGFSPITYKGKGQYLFNKNEVNSILNYSTKAVKLPEIIYIHTTWEIRESKLNTMEL